MELTLPSQAENNAAKAQVLQPFSRFNLVGVRDKLHDLLNHIGRESIFSQYTKHDISHIDTLLEMLDWVIPPATIAVLTPTEWMLVVLAIYFHDAGLVVTKAEFAARDSSDFPAFREDVLNSPIPSPYQERVRTLEPEERERFLYQEFVRVHHAERIKLWINGEDSARFGAAGEVAKIVAELVSDLDDDFRRDLALVCESHHNEDLDKLDKYNPRRAYGSLAKETANLQYAAILLRTVDLLHVTKDRTPSVAFRLSSPTDPKSVEEWAKQMSVVAVRSSPPRDQTGKVEPNAISDTIQVSATFKDPLGYFALTEYLAYAEHQLRRSYQWAEQTRVRESIKYEFPWRRIDTTQVKALTFESKQFAFELDKPKILNLLTGHTLYSNSDVVLRELIQNSLDATRLQSQETGVKGEIAVHLDTAKRLLTISDNGTGMTQKVIEDHFLNVGSSLYRDDEFRKQHPDFSSISRFGIGILSVFMISDEIEVMTKPAVEHQVRNISIRSIHGKYLIRILEPTHPDVPEMIKKHGTQVRLRMRAGVPIPPLRSIAEFWIMFPGCKVTVQIDNEPQVSVGYESPKSALENSLQRAGYQLSDAETEQSSTAYNVIEKRKDGVTLAYAVQWQPFYKNWSFATLNRLTTVLGGQENKIPIGMCVQGIRIDANSPGFAGQQIIAVSNIVGPRSPATNVARSSLETGSLTDNMFQTIYDFYTEQVTSEIRTMASEREVPISEAASEGRFLLAPVQTNLPLSQCPDAKKLLNGHLKEIPWLVLDSGTERSLVTINDLRSRSGFWTLESGAYTSAEAFLRRVPGNASLKQLATLSGWAVVLPKGDIVGGYAESSLLRGLIFEEFEVDRIELQQTARQATLHWRRLASEPLWRNIVPSQPESLQRIEQLIQSSGRLISGRQVRYRSIALQASDELTIAGVEGECGLMGSAQLFIFRDNEVHALLESQFKALGAGLQSESSFALTVIMLNLLLGDDLIDSDSIRMRVFNNVRQQLGQQVNAEVQFPVELRALMEGPKPRVFNPTRGERFNSLSVFSGGMYDLN